MNDVPRIRVIDVHKRFGALEVLRGVSFDVHRGNVVSVIGASGSGKSTLLRCINYLERPNGGEVFIEGEPLGTRVDSGGRRLPPAPGAADQVARAAGGSPGGRPAGPARRSRRAPPAALARRDQQDAARAGRRLSTI